MTDSFLTITKTSIAEIKITKSKFIAQAFPLNSQEEIQEVIKDVKKKYFDASHHPFAFRTGTEKRKFKISDDGEPAGSAGKPILEAIDKHNITDVIVIVSRYFGGTKLGVGGLRRAFFESADFCLSNAGIVEMFISEKIDLEFEYKYMNVVMSLIEKEKIKLLNNNSDEKCKLILDVRLSKKEYLIKELMSLTNGNILFD